ncbi:hypothetical protein PSQ90_02650 [Devosia rhodophyticola]|uniref:DUF2336 domain-containing protein n=1 Tax=Devosia rhodophyticola TaxID=3026423 RepID=A0ABY7YYI1_9HYPH|nr:hypothetical protein [Devosia rhodophyticola]WDR06386.1 hypothetical protein PSQ90_02650 [Devosia rhodophyticola]
MGLIDAVIVEDPVEFAFSGSISHQRAEAIWTWVVRDLCSDIIDHDRVSSDSYEMSELELLMPRILARMKESVARAKSGIEAERRLIAQLGGENGYERLPVVMTALRCRGLLAKAQAFGRATNDMADETALGAALQSMPLQDVPVASLLLHAAVGQVANPSRLIKSVVRVLGSGKEAVVERSGFAPLIDALLAHAQNQLYLLQPTGTFADIDLACRGLDRFHRLIRAVAGFVELSRKSRWGMMVGGMTKQVSERLEPRLKQILPDINQTLRKGREGADRLDDDHLLVALNGIYLLAAIRDCRDSLALNALLDQAWNQTGETLELHLNRNLEALRLNPDDLITARRLEVGIKMAEVRFNRDYADTLRRARLGAERRG